MTSFIVLCAVMLVAAIAIVLFPLLRRVPAPAKGATVPAPATIAAVVLAFALPLAAAALYAKISNFPWGNAQSGSAAPGHADGAGAGSMQEVTVQLEARLKDNPNDAEGWRMLGRTYLITGKAREAVGAYEKALAIVGGGDPSLKVDLAEAIVVSEDAAQQARAKQYIDDALAADANNQKALWYSGVLAYKADDKETATAQWQKLLATNPPDEIRQIVVQQLEQLGVEVPQSTSPPAAATAASGPMTGGGAGAPPEPVGRTIKVSVSVDPSLADKVKPGVPLFIAARQPGIPGPPLAALRLSTDDLPATVVLSDANSMIEGRNLSSVDDVEVVARIAFGGSVMATSGDLVGTAVQKKGGPTDLQVAITKVQP